MGTANLGIGYVAANQNQKEVTINAAADGFDAAICGQTPVTWTSNAATLTQTQFAAGVALLCSGQTANATITLPAGITRLFALQNAGGYPVIVGYPTGSTVSVPAGKNLMIMADGGNCNAITSASSSGAGALSSDSDVSFSGLADGDRLHYSAGLGKWVNGREPYVFAGFAAGVLAGGQILLVHQAAMAITLPANFAAASSGAASQAGATAKATSATVLNVERCTAASDPSVAGNWTTIGTITFAAGGYAGTLATTGGAAQSVAAGDFLRIVGPSPADATLANVFVSLAANR